jgi:aminoglycoside phosphotransferase
MEFEIPIEIKNIVGNLKYTKDNIGRSEDSVYIFENKYILKISKDIDKIKKEKEKNDWLNSHIPGPKSLLLIYKNNYIYYLRECLNGKSLISSDILNDPNFLIDILSKVINILRNLDNKDCPFESEENEGIDFVHGDLCLPNIFVNENNEFIGFIDVGNCGKGDRWYDYSWLLWSFEYNLKNNKFNEILLDKIGIKMNNIKYNEYIPKENINELEKNK